MNIRHDWAAEAGISLSSLGEGRSFGRGARAVRTQQNAADRWPSMAIVIAIHLLIAWLIVHATMKALTKPPESVITVTLTADQAKPAQAAPPQPQLPQLPRLEQMIAPPDVSAPMSQLAVQPPPAPAETAPAPSTPVQPAPKAPAEPAVTPPRFDADYLKNPGPVYPNMSRRLREVGTVQLRVRVSTDGQPLDIQVATSSGNFRLDDAAREVVRKWRFQPAKRGDTAVEAWVLVPMEFSLTHK